MSDKIQKILLLINLKEAKDLDFVTCLTEDVFDTLEFCAKSVTLLGSKVTVTLKSRREVTDKLEEAGR